MRSKSKIWIHLNARSRHKRQITNSKIEGMLENVFPGANDQRETLMDLMNQIKQAARDRLSVTCMENEALDIMNKRIK